MNTSDLLVAGDTYETLKLMVSPELNRQFVNAVDATHPIYNRIVHPSLLHCFCSITQSPSFRLPPNTAAVGAKFASEFVEPLDIGKSVEISWNVVSVYEKRSRTFQVCEVTVVDEDERIILKRVINNTFVGGEYVLRRIQWEKETGFRGAVPMREFPEVGYEITGRTRELTLDKMRYYSGGLPGPDWPDRNIHTDREVCARTGVGKPVASGMMMESYICDLMLSFFGEDWYRGGSSKVISVLMGGEGDTVSPKAFIKKAQPAEGALEVELEVWAENRHGNCLLVGSCTGTLR